MDYDLEDIIDISFNIDDLNLDSFYVKSHNYIYEDFELNIKEKTIKKFKKTTNMYKKRLRNTEINEEDNCITIGTYTRKERRENIKRFHNKRKRYREEIYKNGYRKKILYKCRRNFSLTRKRVKGRFVSS